MTSLILRTTTRYLLPLLLIFSVFLLLRGHHEPGGGFLGGLVVSAAVALCALAFDVPAARQVLRCDPHLLIGAGLLTAGGSGLWALLKRQPFLTAGWEKFSGPRLGEVEIGTPLVFDIGVYLVVIGVTMLILLSLAEE